MHIIVGGCGQLGAAIAERLSDDADNDVVVVDFHPDAFDRLGSAFNGETVLGDVTDRDVLEQAGVTRADALLAVTRFDNANLMAVQVAERLYDVPRVVARLFNPHRETVYRKLGIRYVSGTGVLAKLFLNEFRDASFRQHLDFPHGDVEISELTIGSGGHGLTVADFELDGKLRVAAISRGGRVFIPDPTDRLERTDIVAAATRRGVFRKVARLLDAADERRLGDA